MTGYRLAASSPGLALPGLVTPTSLELPDGLTFDDWKQVGQTLDRIEAGYHWWRGDWLLYGQRRYGRTYEALLAADVGRYQSLANDLWVAKRIDARRRTGLPWTFHRAVAALEADQQDELLRLAADGRWTHRQLAAQIRALSGELSPRGESSERRRLSKTEEQTIFERAEAGEGYAAIAEDFGITEDRVGTVVRQWRARERTPEPVTEQVPLPIGQRWRCLVLDPPWPMDKIEREVHPDQGVALDYPTMPVPDIVTKAPVPDLADPEGCHVYLWTTHRFLPSAWMLLASWGVRYQCLMTWVKPSGFTPYSWMYDTEHVLFGTFGGALPLERQGLKLSFQAPVSRHSAKPDVFYERVREASPGPRLEMFARTARDGFDVWGNEVMRSDPEGGAT